MTISGPIIDLRDLKPLELIEASKAQKYINNLEPELIEVDGSPLYLVHDGSTFTSDIFVGDAWNHLQRYGTIEGTLLSMLIARLISNGNSFRIWYASNDPKAHLNVTDCYSLKKILQVTSEEKQIEIRYLANKAIDPPGDKL